MIAFAHSMLINTCATAVSLTACFSITEWGYKMPTGPEKFAAVPAERVEMLFATPSRPFKRIGIVSVLGGAFSSDVAMYSKLRNKREQKIKAQNHLRNTNEEISFNFATKPASLELRQ
jgi:hypothetical protein